ncbi:MAG: GNAT family N-acetyltransferase [Actinobacteria bacterium]|nr:GNAT family N-acetyltransferase [Actinomycetota bacterium]
MPGAKRGDPSERTARALLAYGRRVAGWVEGGSVHRTGGFLVALTGLPDDSLNVGMVEGEPARPDRALLRVEELFRSRGRRMGLDLPAGRHPHVEAAAGAMALRPIASRPAMALPVGALRGPSRRPGLTIDRVGGAPDLAAVRSIEARVFGTPGHIVRRFLPRAMLRARGVRMYLARLDGEPVACATSFVDRGTVGLFGVATIPTARGLGLATAVTAHAIARAAGRADLAWLQATPAGRPVYERMGFEPVDEWVVWVGRSGAGSA